MGKMRRPGRLRAQRGSSMVEFALIFPILLYVTLGVMDLGRALWHYNTLAEATREGSRYAATHGYNATSPTGPGSPTYTLGPPSTDSAVTAQVQRYTFGLDPGLLAVLSSWPDGDNLIGSHVRVETRYAFQPIALWIVGGMTINLSATSNRRIQF